MKLSFVYLSNRPGSIDILAANMSQQVPVPGVEFELVVIDGYPGRVERGKAEAYLRSKGVPVRHYGLPKTKTFPWSRTGFVNAMNTGIMYATGDYVVFLHDFMALPASAVSNIARLLPMYGDRALIHGVAITYQSQAPAKEDDIDSAIPSAWIPREPWVPEVFEMAYWIAPMSFFEATNGIDERADFCSEWALNCVMAQARFHNYALKVDRMMICHMLDHRVWHDGEVNKDSIYKTHGSLIGKQFTDIPEEPEWSWWSANPYRLDVVRQSLGSKK